MHQYILYTLVDITDTGNLRLPFPFTSKSGELIHNKETLDTAKIQQNNFTTCQQLLQMRANIDHQEGPASQELSVNEMGFGRFYENTQKVWMFSWCVEQADTYASSGDPVGALIDDFDNVPVLAFAKESVTFPTNAFMTKDPQFKNTHFLYGGIQYK